MKKILTLLVLSSLHLINAQSGAPASPYYNSFNFNQTGSALKNALATKITTTHTDFLTYGQAENALKVIDRDPTDLQNVFLIYGFDDTICTFTDDNNFGVSPNWTTHRKRNKQADVADSNECAWNREHVYPVSLATPPLDTQNPGAGTDAHHLRTADVDRNALRGSRKFAAGSGNSTVVGANWYPGDEWKGDVARIIMYMYLHYPTQCKPINVGTGSVVASDPDMLQLFLQWNADDPVSQYEDDRNTYLGTTSTNYGQGNRNPFIDNPYLATIIWGGPAAENRWPSVLGTISFNYDRAVSIYPNPTSNSTITISSTVDWEEIKFTNVNGQTTGTVLNPTFSDNQLEVGNLASGFYFVTFISKNVSTTKKLIVN